MLRRLLPSSARFSKAPGLGSGMRIGRQKANKVGTPQQNVIEELYDLAKTTFQLHKKVVPSEVEQVSELLCELLALPRKRLKKRDILYTLYDLALRASTQPPEEPKSLLQRFGLATSSRVPTITYTHVCENENFGIGIFCIPAGVRLPYHDHPKMTVISRVLFGEIEVVGYDWANPNERSNNYGEPKPARLAVHKTVKPSDPPIILYEASGGNIHSFTAKRSCAILDLLSPPYDIENPGAERQCTYYEEASELQEDGTIMLKKIPDPNTFQIASSKYLGIQVE